MTDAPTPPNELRALQAHLSSADAWPTDEEYVLEVMTEIERLRAAHPDGEYPDWTHGGDDIGCCVSCDALKVLDRLEWDQC